MISDDRGRMVIREATREDARQIAEIVVEDWKMAYRGIIDSDYSHSDNEGHILIRLTCDSKDHKTLSVPAGAAVAQGIFLPYGITSDDDATADRNGGFGSTDSRKVR